MTTYNSRLNMVALCKYAGGNEKAVCASRHQTISHIISKHKRQHYIMYTALGRKGLPLLPTSSVRIIT